MFGRGDRQLRRHAAGDLALQEHEVVGEDRVVEVDLVGDGDRGRRELDVAVGVVELDLDVAGDLLHAAELVDEVHVPGRAAKLTVGRALEPDVALHLDDLADRVVLDRAQIAGRRSARRRTAHAPAAAASAAAGCRRGRPGTAVSCGARRSSRRWLSEPQSSVPALVVGALTLISTRTPSGSSKNSCRGPPPGTSLRIGAIPRSARRPSTSS